MYVSLPNAILREPAEYERMDRKIDILHTYRPTPLNPPQRISRRVATKI
jgi:hypothetical protein